MNALSVHQQAKSVPKAYFRLSLIKIEATLNKAIMVLAARALSITILYFVNDGEWQSVLLILRYSYYHN